MPELHFTSISLLYRWCIQRKWKLLLTYDGEVVKFPDIHAWTEKHPQLFDLKKDPHELKNLAAENPEIVAKMVAQIDGRYPVKRAKTVKVFK